MENKSLSKKSSDTQIFSNHTIGFEWDVTPNYFNNNCESDESDGVSLSKLLYLIFYWRLIQKN